MIEDTPPPGPVAFHADPLLALPVEFGPVALLGCSQLGERLRQSLNPIFGRGFTDCHKCFLLRAVQDGKKLSLP